jgi:hypothetical protein
MTIRRHAFLQGYNFLAVYILITFVKQFWNNN